MKSYWVRMGSRGLGLCVMLLAMAGLIGCGGGSSSPPPTPNADPTGYYDLNGSATVISLFTNNPVTLSNMEAIVYNNHILMFSADGLELYDIKITNITGSKFTGTARIFYEISTQSTMTATVVGTINEGSSITGTMTGSYYGSGTFSLTYSNQMGVVPTMVTNWGLPVEFSGSNYVLSTDGKGGISTNTTNPITNGNFVGCAIGSGGTISEIGTSKLYDVAVTISGCTADTTYNGDYTGMAVIQDAAASALDLEIIKSDGTHSVSGSFAVQ